MKLYKEKLLKVETSTNDKKETNHYLIFKSKHFDKGLEEWIPSSLRIKLSPEHHHLLVQYQRLQGEHLIIPIDLYSPSNSSNIYFRTGDDGQPISLKDTPPK